MPAFFDAVLSEHQMDNNNKDMGDKTNDFSWAVRVKSVGVSGNWRVTFVFDGQDAANVNLEDYH